MGLVASYDYMSLLVALVSIAVSLDYLFKWLVWGMSTGVGRQYPWKDAPAGIRTNHDAAVTVTKMY